MNLKCVYRQLFIVCTFLIVFVSCEKSDSDQYSHIKSGPIVINGETYKIDNTNTTPSFMLLNDRLSLVFIFIDKYERKVTGHFFFTINGEPSKGQELKELNHFEVERFDDYGECSSNKYLGGAIIVSDISKKSITISLNNYMLGIEEAYSGDIKRTLKLNGTITLPYIPYSDLR